MINRFNSIVLFFCLSIAACKAYRFEYQCETLSIQFSNRLTQLTYDENEKINEVLEQWHDECGNNEPIARVFLLNKIYSNDTLGVSIEINNYFSKYFDKFLFRMDLAYYKKGIPIGSAKKFLPQFDFVPFGESFDIWSINFSNIILNSKDRYNTETLVFLYLMKNDLNQFKTLLDKLPIDHFYKVSIQNSPSLQKLPKY